jgi:hypothetical protein
VLSGNINFSDWNVMMNSMRALTPGFIAGWDVLAIIYLRMIPDGHSGN